MISRDAIVTGVVVLCLLLPGKLLNAQVTLSNRSSGDNIFQLGAPGAVQLCYDAGDAVVVAKTAALFAEDVYKVTGQRIRVGTAFNGRVKNGIIVGTVSGNPLIRELVRQGKIDVANMEQGWEQYAVAIVKRPVKGVDKALVIAGSDRRGAAYGLLSVSEAIGVSPWYWWADVPVKKRRQLFVAVKPFVSKPPSVKYRGIFINDEDWGLKPWASKTFDPQLGDIGPKTYAGICELLLRLKANYLSPAMHSCSGAFNKYDENKRVADSFGIVMGSIHCEPLLFNNATEWDSKTMGAWDYVKNKQGINKVLAQRVQDNGQFENVYTLALRGIHDAVMSGNLTLQQQVAVLGKALKDQRQILKDVLKKPLDDVPQVFYPYKEVLEIYNAGLEVPDDVTLIWTDDDYGYMKRLSNAREQQRKGRAGVYYHLSYWGPPNDNLWLCTTSPALMYEELKKAYETTADRLWVVNVGDIKPAEYHLSLFMEMAYDMDRFNHQNIVEHEADFLSGIYGDSYRERFLDISKTYHQLAFARKPEYMKNLRSDQFSPLHYRESDNRLQAYQRIAAETEAILKELPGAEVPSFFQLLYYPVKATALFNRMWLTAGKQAVYAQQDRMSANLLKSEVLAAADTLRQITHTYDTLLNGKWKGMMALSNGGGRFAAPPMDTVRASAASSWGVSAENAAGPAIAASFQLLPVFNKFLPRSYYVDVFNKGSGVLKWNVVPSAAWIRTDKRSGVTAVQDRFYVSVDWSRVPAGEKVKENIKIRAGDGQEETVLVSVYNPSQPSKQALTGLYVENNGYVSIPADGFHRKKETADIKFRVLEGLGLDDKVVQLGAPLAKAPYYPSLELTSNYVAPVRSGDFPVLEYDFYSFDAGPVDVYTYMVPVFPLDGEHGSRYGVMVDDSPVYLPEASAPYYSTPWIQSVLRNTRINKTTHVLRKPGKHTLKIYAGHPGMLLQKIVIDLGGLQRSYMGPAATRAK